MAEGGPSRNVSENDEDIECIQRSELSQGREVVQRTFLTDKKTGLSKNLKNQIVHHFFFV